MDPARLAAFDVLKTVRVDKAYTNLVLPAAISHYKLSGRDAAFTTELASGTIRLRGTYDAIIAACSDRPMTKIEARVLDALRLGAHQLLSMRVPVARGDQHHRRPRAPADRARARRASPTRCSGRSPSTTSTSGSPGWPRTRGRRRPGTPRSPTATRPGSSTSCADAVGEAELADLLAADNVAPAVTLVARPGRSTRDELPGEPTAYSPYGVVLAGGDPGAVPAVAEGRAGVQDEGSQLVATVLADAPLDGPGPALARPVRRARAASPRCWPVSRPSAVPAWSPTSSSRTAPGLVARALRGADGVAGIVTADGTRPPYRARQLRPGAGRRALHRAGRAAPPAGGAVGAQARRPGHPR